MAPALQVYASAILLIPIAETVDCGVGVSSGGTVFIPSTVKFSLLAQSWNGRRRYVCARAQENCLEKPYYFLRSKERGLRLNIF